MVYITGEEIPTYEEKSPGEVIFAFFDEEVEADDQVELYTKGFSNILIGIKVDGACTVTLDTVAPVSHDYETEHSVSTSETINQIVKTFAVAGSDKINLNEIITDKEALQYNYLRFKFSAGVTASFYAIGKLTSDYELIKQCPLVKDGQFNTAVTANTDIFAAVLTPSYATPQHNTYFRIYCAFDTAGVLTVRRTQGGVTVSENLNSGAALAANAAYAFDIVVRENQTMQLRYSANAIALELSVSGIGGGI